MIYGTLEQSADFHRYLPGEVAAILDRIKKGDFHDLTGGKHPYRGELVYLSADTYQTAPATQRQYEFHRKYVDLQVVLSGEEYIYLAPPLPGWQEEQMPENDCRFADGVADSSYIKMSAGNFLLILPGQLHKPCCHTTGEHRVQKLVVKIAAELFALNH